MVNEIIEEVVTFENGGLNTSVDAMVEVSTPHLLSLSLSVVALLHFCGHCSCSATSKIVN